jgi:hypothetical protein
MINRYPKLWPEWVDMVDMLEREGVDVELHEGRPIHKRGVGFWLEELASTSLSHNQVVSIMGLLSDVIDAVKAQCES